MKRLLAYLAHRSGFRLQPLPPATAPAAAAIGRVRQHTMLPYPRLEALFDQCRHVETTPLSGAYVQCGVWRGGSAGLMALANLQYGKARRPLHLFDTFAGIPQPDAQIDGPRAVGEAERAGIGTEGRLESNPGFYENMGRAVGRIDDSRGLLLDEIGYDEAEVHYHIGLFQETVPQAQDLGPIALLHLDGDWYASTRVCLEHLYDRVVIGGLVVLDDYGAYEGCARAVDEFLRCRGIRAYLHPIDAESRLLIKP